MLSGKHILIENCPGLGDLVMLTPALRRIKEFYPDCVLSVVSYANNLPLVDRLPYVDYVYAIEKGKFLGHFRPARAFPKQDYVIFTTWQPQLARMAWLLRVQNRAGVTKENGRGRGLFTKELPRDDFYDTENKALFLAKQIAVGLGIDLNVDGICEVSQPDETEFDRVKQLLRDMGKDISRPFAVLAPFAKTARDIPVSLIIGIVKYLRKKYDLDCIITHSERMKEVDEVRREIGDKGLYDISGKTNLMEMVALFKLASVAVVTDSGPMHVSCAVGTETVSVFSSGNHRQWNPMCHSHLITLGCECSPCTRETAEECSSQKCILGITPKMVKEKIDEAMAVIGGKID